MSGASTIPVVDVAASCSPITRTPIDATQADDLACSIRALADPTRLRLISIVAASPDREACVCDLTDGVDLSQPTVSHHLRILTEAGFLSRTKRGTSAYYRIVPGALDALSGLLGP